MLQKSGLKNERYDPRNNKSDTIKLYYRKIYDPQNAKNDPEIIKNDPTV